MSDLGSHDNDVPFTVLDLWRPDGKGGRVLAPVSDRGRFAQRAGAAPGARARDDAGDLSVRGGRHAARAQAGLAPGRQQAAGLGAGVGQALVRVHRRQWHAARQREAAARRAVQGLQDAAGDAAPFARPLGGVGQLCQGQRSRAGFELPVFRLDDRGEPPRQRRLPHGKKDRMGLRRRCGPPTRRTPRRSSSGPSIAKAGRAF